MDLEPAEPEPAPTTEVTARRSLFARSGAAGLAGLVAALVVDRRSVAAPPDTSDTPDATTTTMRPNVPTESDKALLETVLGFERSASRLYEAKLEAGVSDDLGAVAGVMSQNHLAYAQAIAGETGLSLQSADNSFLDANIARFTGTDRSFLEAAHELEQTAVSTHTSLIDRYESDEAIALTASILVIEARHATVLADLLGVDDLDVVFGNDQPALSLSGTDAT